jgi:FAD/FMN-containing dehydrogenase
MVVELTVDKLRSQVTGEVIEPGDEAYEEARKVLNGMIDKRPRVIVRAATTADVAAAVDFARDRGMDVAVRGGAHSVPGFGTTDDGIVIDLTRMNTVNVDPDARTARAGGGTTWGVFNEATGAHGLATTGGIISTTGVGGLTLGGGIGYLARGRGLSCDNLVSAEIVTADGHTLRASEAENEDLFWAIRGGGGNFGVVTEFEFRLHPVNEIYGGPIFFEAEDAGDILRFYRDFIQDAPEEFGGFPAWQIAPPLPFIPEARHGDTLFAFVTCWVGEPGEGERVIQRIRDVAPVVAEHVGAMPYHALNSAFDALYPPGLQQYWKANFVKELSDEAIEAHVAHGPSVPTVSSTMHIYPINGACHRVASDETAFAYRDATFATVIVGAWPEAKDNEANTKWVRDYYDATAPLSEEGGYVNFMAGDDQGRIQANYKGNYDRLVSVKRRYDSDNLFHLNQNIKP